jgi:hypothetical protein
VKIFREVSRLPEFERDLKKLLKRFRTLEEDLEVFTKTELNLYHKLGLDMIQRSTRPRNLPASL